MMLTSKEEGKTIAAQLEQAYAGAKQSVSQDLYALAIRANSRYGSLEAIRRQLETMQNEMADDVNRFERLTRLPEAQEFLSDLELTCFALTTAAGRDLGTYAEMKRFYEDLCTIATSLAVSLADARAASFKARNAVEELSDRNSAVGRRVDAFLADQR